MCVTMIVKYSTRPHLFTSCGKSFVKGHTIGDTRGNWQVGSTIRGRINSHGFRRNVLRSGCFVRRILFFSWNCMTCRTNRILTKCKKRNGGSCSTQNSTSRGNSSNPFFANHLLLSLCFLIYRYSRIISILVVCGINYCFIVIHNTTIIWSINILRHNESV